MRWLRAPCTFDGGRVLVGVLLDTTLPGSDTERHNLQVLDRRWSFADMQRVKLEDQATPETKGAAAGSTKSEIFVMMPLDIIAVGEQKEGKRRIDPSLQAQQF